MNRIAEKYQSTDKAQLKDELKLGNIHQVPELLKITINSGVSRAVQDSKQIDTVVASLEKIAGQKAVVTKARHSVAGFKLREDMPIGVMVTLRGERMYNFLDRLIAVVIPRLRDFHGLSRKSFDKSGNYSIGFADQTVFPEISYEDASAIHGLQITLVTSGTDREASEKMLEKLGLPFTKGDR